MGFRLEYSVPAKCKPEHVWKKFEKVEEWGWWNPVIGKTRWLDGPRWQKGSHFLFELLRPSHRTFKPVITESELPNRIEWVGTALGFNGQHGFSFEEQSDGTTLIKTWEMLSGPLTWFMGEGLKNNLTAMYREWLEALKAEAEKIAREDFARAPSAEASRRA
jgi:hypothetical protein